MSTTAAPSPSPTPFVMAFPIFAMGAAAAVDIVKMVLTFAADAGTIDLSNGTLGVAFSMAGDEVVLTGEVSAVFPAAAALSDSGVLDSPIARRRNKMIANAKGRLAVEAA